MAIIDKRVSLGTDDCWRKLETTPSFDLTGGALIAGAYDGSNYKYGVGMRFQGITIPQGATITAAYVKFTAYRSDSADDCLTYISAEDVDDAPTFADDAAAFDTRFANHTTARVSWAVPHWAGGSEYNSAEIKTVIQEIVNRAGWASGNDIVIFWEDFDDRSTHNGSRRWTESYEHAPTKAPLLHIEYTVAAVGRSHGYIFG